MSAWKCFADFIAYGIPKGQPRPRAFSRGGHASVYDPGTAEGWKGSVALAAREFLPPEPLDEPLRVMLQFFMPRPARLKGEASAPHTGKPDCDNLAKAVLDALTGISMWRDDSLVCSLDVEKRYCAKNHRPGAVISIYTEERTNE